MPPKRHFATVHDLDDDDNLHVEHTVYDGVTRSVVHYYIPFENRRVRIPTSYLSATGTPSLTRAPQPNIPLPKSQAPPTNSPRAGDPPAALPPRFTVPATVDFGPSPGSSASNKKSKKQDAKASDSTHTSAQKIPQHLKKQRVTPPLSVLKGPAIPRNLGWSLEVGPGIRGGKPRFVRPLDYQNVAAEDMIIVYCSKYGVAKRDSNRACMLYEGPTDDIIEQLREYKEDQGDARRGLVDEREGEGKGRARRSKRVAVGLGVGL